MRLLIPKLKKVPIAVAYDITQGSEIIGSGTLNNLNGTVTKNGVILTVFPPHPEIPGSYIINVYYDKDGIYAASSEEVTIEDEELNKHFFTLKPEIYVDFDVCTLYLDNTEVEHNISILSPQNILTFNANPSIRPLMIYLESDKGFETRNLYYITPSILSCVNELRTFFDRLNLEARITKYLSDIDYLDFLKSGEDRFNLIPQHTAFSLTNAKGSIRELWLMCSKLHGLRVRYLEEGFTSFNYSGSSVTLDVDVTQYLDSTASALESRIESEGVPLKKSLAAMGILSGDGSVSRSTRVPGAMGTTMSPVTSRRFPLFPQY
jgi:hypothetical protein